MNKHGKKILHITAHMGGGVGKVLSGVAGEDKKNAHSLILLERPEKTNFLDILRDASIPLTITPTPSQLLEEIKKADIVELEWWHHPLMADLLANFPKLAIRLILWSHVSGAYYPYIPEDFLKVPTKFIFTSPYSKENPFWDIATKTWANKNTATIYSSGGFREIGEELLEHGGFNIGYVGTQSYSKLNNNVLDFYAAVANDQEFSIPKLRFSFVGDTSNKKALIKAGKNLGIALNLAFIDYTAKVSDELAKMDIFAYLLNPQHFGTTENALLEAMAIGLPVIALNQCTEKHLIIDGETGLLVNNIAEFKHAVKSLYKSPELRKIIGENAKSYVRTHFSIKNTVANLNAVYDEIMTLPKKTCSFSHILKSTPTDYFLAFLPPPIKESFIAALQMNSRLKDVPAIEELIKNLPPILKEETKSSIKHFARTYPKDIRLQKWQNMLE